MITSTVTTPARAKASDRVTFLPGVAPTPLNTAFEVAASPSKRIGLFWIQILLA